jgi:hypothetical protein
MRDVLGVGHGHRAVERHRRGAELIEERRAAAQEDRDQVDPDLVEQGGVEALARDGPPLTPTPRLPASSLAISTACSIASVTSANRSPSGGQPPGTRWVSTTTGLPIGWSPAQPRVTSNG